MQVEMHTREASIEDLADLLSFEQKVIDAERPFNVAIKIDNACYYDIQKLITESNSIVLVAEIDSKIIATGYSQIRISKQSLQHEKHAYLGFMFVDVDYRGLGINKCIIEALLAWGKSQGVNDHYLDVYTQNGPAINAYQKLGFEPSIIEMKLTN